jgi:hypothetical protein
MAPRPRRSIPHGRDWTTFRNAFARTARHVCYYCHHPVTPGLAEVHHLISPKIEPRLTFARSNLRIVHGGGKRRCPVCDRSCNTMMERKGIPRDSNGIALPLPPEEADAEPVRPPGREW